MNVSHKSTKRHLMISALALTAAIGTASAAGGGKLIYNGKVASTDVRTISGSPYVKLSDMASAMGLIVVKRGDSYELTKKGGANQVDGLQGKIGDTLFNGEWRFTVLSTSTPESYAIKIPAVRADLRGTANITIDESTGLVRPASGYKLVVIPCRMSNGQKSSQTFWVAPTMGVKTALADTEGESHPPFGFDMEGSQNQSKPLVPGASSSFTILFIVPEATQSKDLIFTLRNNGEGKISNVRVSLKAP